MTPNWKCSAHRKKTAPDRTKVLETRMRNALRRRGYAGVESFRAAPMSRRDFLMTRDVGPATLRHLETRLGGPLTEDGKGQK